jgi:hypothetical protein
VCGVREGSKREGEGLVCVELRYFTILHRRCIAAAAAVAVALTLPLTLSLMLERFKHLYSV